MVYITLKSELGKPVCELNYPSNVSSYFNKNMKFYKLLVIRYIQWHEFLEHSGSTDWGYCSKAISNVLYCILYICISLSHTTILL